MKHHANKIKRRIQSSYRIIIICAAVTAIILSFPNTGSFKYEFHKGTPWKHETLIAPFDFAIYKTDKELAEERLNILKNYSPYFSYKDSVYTENMSSFTKHFNRKWDNFNFPNRVRKDSNLLVRLRSASLDACINAFKQAYSRGITDNTSDIFQTGNEITNITIIKDNIAEKTSIINTFTPKSAYSFVNNLIDEKLTERYLKQFANTLDISTFIYPNLFFDIAKSEQYKEQLLSNISKTEGMVKAGERIVMKGDIIDFNTYKIISSLKTEYETFMGASEKHKLIVAGKILLIIIALMLVVMYLFNFRKRIYYNNRKFLFIFTVVTLMTATGAIVSNIPFLDIMIFPFVLIPIIIKNFMDGRTGVCAFLSSILIIGYIVPNSYEFVFMQMGAGLVAIYTLNRLHRRGQLVLTAGSVFLTYTTIYIAFSITQEGDILHTDWYKILWIAGNCFMLTLSYPLVYIFEKLFGFVSDTTLIELSNPNHPLLRKLTQKAPGTFQHSLQVANLAEEAIYLIGGNPLLVRTGALYHDIGKMHNPHFFIENQTPGEKSPHEQLDFDESAKYITDHVKDGIKLAQKHKLPDQIIHFIKTHHGSGKALFFYNSFKNKYPDREIDEDVFTYPGPDPFSKETAVLMMADSVEAASRSLPEKSEEAIGKLVSDIIDKQLKDGRFDNVDISLKNISDIKKVFTEMLININHARIQYPKAADEK